MRRVLTTYLILFLIFIAPIPLSSFNLGADETVFLYTDEELSLEVNPPKNETYPGGACTYNVDVNGTYTGVVSLSYEWTDFTPPGVELSIAPEEGTAPFSAKLRINTSNYTPPGNYTLLIMARGAGGSPRAQTEVVLHVMIPDFSISVNPKEGSVQKGDSITFSVVVRPTRGFTSKVDLNVTGLPLGATHTFSIESMTPFFTSTLVIKTSSSTPVGTYTITVVGSGGGRTHYETITLEVIQAYGFNISVKPIYGNTTQGGSVTYDVNVTALGDFKSPVSLMVAGLPTGCSIISSVNNAPPNFVATLTIRTSDQTPTGNYTLHVVGIGGGMTKYSNSFVMEITDITTQTPYPTETPNPTETPPSTLEPFNFSLLVFPSELKIAPESSASVTIRIIPVKGFPEPVSLSVQGLPEDASFSLSQESVPPPFVAVSLNIVAGKTTGNFSILITGSDGGITRTARVLLIIEEERRCVIATATFGSELSPHVQELRYFRDNIVMRTFAGRGFMRVFNAFYYSWSTPVAELILRHEIIRRTLRITLYPLLGILQASRIFFDLISGASAEMGVIGAGILASSLIGAVYLAPLVALILVAIKPNNVHHLKDKRSYLTIILGLITLVSGEVLGSAWLVMLGSSLLVVCTTLLTSLLVGLELYFWTQTLRFKR